MDNFLSQSELQKGHEVAIDLDRLARVMKAKTPDEMKEALKYRAKKPKGTAKTTGADKDSGDAPSTVKAAESDNLEVIPEEKEDSGSGSKKNETGAPPDTKQEASEPIRTEQSQKDELVVKELFGKLDKGEQVDADEKFIRGSFKTNWIYRPAPVQRNIFSKDFAYKEKDEEYNIW